MRIALVEPFFTGSHKSWAEGYQKYSSHQVEIISLPGRHWKWRMHGGAVSLAKQLSEFGKDIDLVLATDMMDLALFKSLTNQRLAGVPYVLYFHENQLTYPWSLRDEDRSLKRDIHYGFINYSSALAADAIFFNSTYHRESFLGALPSFLSAFPDYPELESVEQIAAKCETLSLGMELTPFYNKKSTIQEGAATLLWNHRWEYDKAPEQFFAVLRELEQKGVDFRLILLGEQYRELPQTCETALKHFERKIIHRGYLPDKQSYIEMVQQADIMPVTSIQDFFGGSVVEAMSAGVCPILPNRLAFPEHIPEKYQSQLLYKDESELFLRLEEMISDIERFRALPVASFVMQYDWQYMAPLYDAQLSSLFE